jgi:hypothetical protein
MTPISKDSLRDILEDKIASFPKPKKIVGWYCLGSKNKVDCVSFGTYSKPNFIKRFFMRTLLDFYWIKETQQ